MNAQIVFERQIDSSRLKDAVRHSDLVVQSDVFTALLASSSSSSSSSSLLLLFVVANTSVNVSADKKELIKFWKFSSGYESRIFKDYSALRDRTFFHNLANISGKKTGSS